MGRVLSHVQGNDICELTAYLLNGAGSNLNNFFSGDFGVLPSHFCFLPRQPLKKRPKALLCSPKYRSVEPRLYIFVTRPG